jgi:hypothetical protein
MLARTRKINENKLKKRREEDKIRKEEREEKEACQSIVEEVIGRSALHPSNQWCFNIGWIEVSGSLLYEKRTLCPFL